MRHWGGGSWAPVEAPSPLCAAWRAHLGAVDSLHDDVGGVDQIDDVHHSNDVLVVQLLQDVHLRREEGGGW